MMTKQLQQKKDKGAAHLFSGDALIPLSCLLLLLTGQNTRKGQDSKKETFTLPQLTLWTLTQVGVRVALAAGFRVHTAETYALDLGIKAVQPRRLIKPPPSCHFEAGEAPFSA